MKLDSALNLEAKDASKNIENSGKSHFLRPNNYTGLLLEILEDFRVCYEKIVVYHHHQRRHIYISTTFLL